MKLSKKYLVVSALAVVVGFLGFSNDAQAKECFRYDVPVDMVEDTYVPGLGYFIGYNRFGQGIFSTQRASSYAIIIGSGEIDNNPYSETEKALQEYVFEEEYCNKLYEGCDDYVFTEGDRKSLMSGSFSDDIMDDLFKNTKTERSKAFKTYIHLEQLGYSINDIYVLMTPLNFSDEIMQDMFYSVYHPEAFVGPKF